MNSRPVARPLTVLALWLGLGTLPAHAAAPCDHGRIELLRDTSGIPHVFADTDAGAM